jgi:thiamine-phosphate diphosphorylase
MSTRSRPFKLPPLYAILDPEQTRGRAPEEVLKELLSGGARILQLRIKALPTRDFHDLARRLHDAMRSSGCSLVINDRVDIALACSATGVHLGQDDLPLWVARRLLPDKVIGISTHDLEQARQAEREGADYIGFGPVFGTKTKDTGYSSRDLAMLEEIRRNVSIPIVAIGGITETNASEVWRAGADSVAIISDILSAPHISEKVKSILSLHHQ